MVSRTLLVCASLWAALAALAVVPSGAFSFMETFEAVRSLFVGSGAPLYPSVEEAAKATEHLNNVDVVDHSQTGLPKIRIGHRVVDLFHGMHFDDILMDTPGEARPPGVVVFYDSNDAQCMRRYNALNFDTTAESQLPPRVNLFTARYDVYSAPRRTWYEFTPEMDLAKRFKVDACPQMVFIPRKCNGHTKWCERGPDPEDPALKVLGCENFEEQCVGTQKWSGSGSYVDWIKDLTAKEGRPKLIPFLENYKTQGVWIQKREFTTCNTHFRNSFLAQAFPAFTYRGFKQMETPKEFQQWLLDFHKRNEKHRRTENWHGESTQLSFHEVRTSFIDLDRERYEKERMAKKYLQPIVEEWSGMGDLELTSFYGIREYHDGSWLRQHIDRIDTHVLSVTLTVDKRNVKPGAKPWPLQVTDWTGKQVSYDHPPGTMILYESSKLPHGRPEPNFSGDHLGAFLHFKPKHMNSRDASKWDDIANKARKNMHLHMDSAPFRQTEVEEPTTYEYTGGGYAEESIWEKPGSPNADPGLSVEFKNEADRSLQVFWYHKTQPEPVLQGKAWPGATFEINTFEGHTFFWAEIDSQEPLPGGKVTIDAGKKVYTYNLGKDGKKAPASQWANVVKDKIKEES